MWGILPSFRRKNSLIMDERPKKTRNNQAAPKEPEESVSKVDFVVGYIWQQVKKQ